MVSIQTKKTGPQSDGGIIPFHINYIHFCKQIQFHTKKLVHFEETTEASTAHGTLIEIIRGKLHK